jgi:hypothetical protein
MQTALETEPEPTIVAIKVDSHLFPKEITATLAPPSCSSQPALSHGAGVYVRMIGGQLDTPSSGATITTSPHFFGDAAQAADPSLVSFFGFNQILKVPTQPEDRYTKSSPMTPRTVSALIPRSDPSASSLAKRRASRGSVASLLDSVSQPSRTQSVSENTVEAPASSETLPGWELHVDYLVCDREKKLLQATCPQVSFCSEV